MDRLSEIKNFQQGQGEFKEKTNVINNNSPFEINIVTEPALVAQQKIYAPVETSLVKIKNNTKKINSLIKLESNAASEKETKEINTTASDLVSETMGIIADIRQRMKNSKDDNASHTKKFPQAATTQIRNNLYASTFKSVKLTIDSFEAALQNLKTSIHATQKSKLLVAGVPEKKIKQVLESGQAEQLLKQISQQSDLNEILDDIESRHDDIVSLERKINDIHQLFQDLAFIVDLQTDFINNIASHINNAKDHVNKGVDALQTSEEYINLSRRRSICMIVCLLILILVIAIPIVVKLQSEP
jgi:syntaxin 1B/2/3